MATAIAFRRVFDQDGLLLSGAVRAGTMHLLFAAVDRRHDVDAVDVAGLAMTDPGPDLVDTLLGLFDHLYCFVPFHLESDFRALDFHFFYVHPPVNLFFLCVVGPWGALVIFEQFLNVFLFFLFAQ